MSSGKTKIISFVIVLSIIVIGLVISFIQYYHTSLDGDLVWHVLPWGDLDKVLNDPLGLKAISNNTTYRGAGRWFCHWTVYHLFRTGYFFLVRLDKNRIEDLYLTSTLFQWFCQWLMVAVISLYANVWRKFTFLNFLWTSALVLLFFRYKNCFNAAIIDHAVTYTVFYAFPLGLLMLFFYPFFRLIFYPNTSQKFHPLVTIGVVMLGLILAFSGPLIPVLGAMFGSVLLLILFARNYNGSFSFGNILKSIKQIPVTAGILLCCFILLWMYDYYVGTFNSENSTHVTVLKRYQLMFAGVREYLFTSGLPYFFGLLITDYILLRLNAAEKLKSKQFIFLKIMAIVIAAFLLLLPLGGYREYRPNIWRYDVTMPLTVFLSVCIASATIILFNVLKGLRKILFMIITLGTLLIFWLKNFPIENGRGEQQIMLQILANTKSDSVVCLPYSSNFFDWGKIPNPERALPVTKMLYEWGITKRPVAFYQK